MARTLLAGLLTLMSLKLLACAPGPRTDLLIFAASSLTEAAEDLEGALAERQPDWVLRSSLAGSQTLRLQLEQGAPADLFLSADPHSVDALEEQGLLRTRAPLAGNRLSLITPAGDERIRSLEDLPRAERIVLAQEGVPVGRYTRALLEAAQGRYGSDFIPRVRAGLISEENQARAVRARVLQGEADAGIVFHTDSLEVPGLRVVPLPEDLNPRSELVLALPRAAPHPEAAEEAMDFLLSDSGQELLERRGFLRSRP